MIRLPLITVLDMQSQKVVNLAAPTGNNDAATKAYVDTATGSVIIPLYSTGSDYVQGEAVWYNGVAYRANEAITNAPATLDTTKWTAISDDDVVYTAANGTITIDATNKTIKVSTDGITNTEIADDAVETAQIKDDAVTADKIATGAVGNDQLANGSVSTNKIGVHAVTAGQLAHNSVGPSQLQNDAVTSSKIASGAVGTTEIGTSAVTTAKINTGAVTQDKLGADAVTNAKLADSAVQTENIADNAVTSTKIAANAVSSGKIADNAVTTSEINDGAVTTAKIANEAVTNGKIGDAAVGSEEIADNAVITSKINTGAVTEDKLGADSVTNAKIADSAVQSENLAANSVTSGKIANNAITESKMADDSVGQPELKDNSVGTAQIIDANVTHAKLAANAVDSSNLADNAVTTGKIAENAVTSDEIQNGAVGSAEIAAGAVTETKIANNAIVSSKIDGEAVTAAKLAEGSVTNSKLGADAVDNSKLADNAVRTENITDLSVTTAKVANAAITRAKLSAELSGEVLPAQFEGWWLSGSTANSGGLMQLADADGTLVQSGNYEDIRRIRFNRHSSNIADSQDPSAQYNVAQGNNLEGVKVGSIISLIQLGDDGSQPNDYNYIHARVTATDTSNSNYVQFTVTLDSFSGAVPGTGYNYIALFSVWDAKLIDGTAISYESIETEMLKDSAVTTAKINDDAVTQAKVADNAIGTDQILDANVTRAKIAAAYTNDLLSPQFQGWWLSGTTPNDAGTMGLRNNSSYLSSGNYSAVTTLRINHSSSDIADSQSPSANYNVAQETNLDSVQIGSLIHLVQLNDDGSTPTSPDFLVGSVNAIDSTNADYVEFGITILSASGSIESDGLNFSLYFSINHARLLDGRALAHSTVSHDAIADDAIARDQLADDSTFTRTHVGTVAAPGVAEHDKRILLDDGTWEDIRTAVYGDEFGYYNYTIPQVNGQTAGDLGFRKTVDGSFADFTQDESYSLITRLQISEWAFDSFTQAIAGLTGLNYAGTKPMNSFIGGLQVGDIIAMGSATGTPPVYDHSFHARVTTAPVRVVGTDSNDPTPTDGNNRSYFNIGVEVIHSNGTFEGSTNRSWQFIGVRRAVDIWGANIIPDSIPTDRLDDPVDVRGGIAEGRYVVVNTDTTGLAYLAVNDIPDKTFYRGCVRTDTASDVFMIRRRVVSAGVVTNRWNTWNGSQVVRQLTQRMNRPTNNGPLHLEGTLANYDTNENYSSTVTITISGEGTSIGTWSWNYEDIDVVDGQLQVPIADTTFTLVQGQANHLSVFNFTNPINIEDTEAARLVYLERLSGWTENMPS